MARRPGLTSMKDNLIYSVSEASCTYAKHILVALNLSGHYFCDAAGVSRRSNLHEEDIHEDGSNSSVRSQL